jgi:hypothetical protein
MQEITFDLARLLWPVEPAAFFQNTWEKQPLAIARQDPAYYRSLFTLRDVDTVLAFTRPKFLEPADFKKDGAPAHTFVQGWLPDDEPTTVPFYPDLAEVHRAFVKGQTLILTAMQQRWAPIAVLCRRLEAFFTCPVHTNLYLTPKAAQGFAAHFDTHEVFVLQIEGTKHWRFYGVARDLPLAEEYTTVAHDRLGPPTREAVLEPGDLLYMPRGHIHEAFTSDSLSLHLTVGIKVFRLADLLHLAVDELSAREVRCRASLPPGLLTDGAVPEALAKEFRELLQVVARQAQAEQAVAHLAESFISKLTTLPGSSFAAGQADQVGLDTTLEQAPGTIGRLAPTEDGRASLRFPGGFLDGPAKIASALRFMVGTPRFKVRSLPDNLTDEAKLVLARRLVRDKFLTVAQPLPSDNGS